jgi:hypothetical protein
MDSNIVDLRSRRTKAVPSTYRHALTKQRGGVVEWSDDNQQEWLMALVSKERNLSRAAIRVGVLINAIECKTARFDWALIKAALNGLGYNDAQLYEAIEDLKRAGLMSPAPAPPVTAMP